MERVDKGPRPKVRRNIEFSPNIYCMVTNLYSAGNKSVGNAEKEENSSHCVTASGSAGESAVQVRMKMRYRSGHHLAL